MRSANPLAALLDAQVDAHHAGVTQGEVTILQAIGEEIAAMAERIASQLASTTDARMVTSWIGNGERRAAVTISAADLAIDMAEAALGLLDAYPVVRTAAELRLSTIPTAASRSTPHISVAA